MIFIKPFHANIPIYFKFFQNSAAKMGLFEKIVNGFQLLIIFAKVSILAA